MRNIDKIGEVATNFFSRVHAVVAKRIPVDQRLDMLMFLGDIEGRFTAVQETPDNQEALQHILGDIVNRHQDPRFRNTFQGEILIKYCLLLAEHAVDCEEGSSSLLIYIYRLYEQLKTVNSQDDLQNAFISILGYNPNVPAQLMPPQEEDWYKFVAIARNFGFFENATKSIPLPPQYAANQEQASQGKYDENERIIHQAFSLLYRYDRLFAKICEKESETDENSLRNLEGESEQGDDIPHTPSGFGR